jgi:phage pi2 protein 07
MNDENKNVVSGNELASVNVVKVEKKIEITKTEYAKLNEIKAKMLKYKAINERSYKRRNAFIKLMLAKAENAKIVVTDSEIDKYLEKNK